MSVHHNIFRSYSQQDATFLDSLVSKDALRVSGGSSTHRQEHTTVHTASDIVNCDDRVKYVTNKFVYNYIPFNF